MKKFPIGKAFTLLEPGPVVLVATHDGNKPNIMTVSWTMVMDFEGTFALSTGPWNYSFAALRDTRECVIAIPTIDLIDKVIRVGTCSGGDVDKFETIGFTPREGNFVQAPLLEECLANIECRVTDLVDGHAIVVLETLAAHIDPARKERRMIHAVGDGTFIADGERFDRREMMKSKLPAGV